jgi:predicted membrane channel-forming protein YqfA (hemolysin III family)
MSMLLTLLMIYFGLVMLWAAPRLYRLLRTRISLLLSGYAVPDCYHATRHADPLQDR